MKFTYKIMLVPLLAALAFGLLFFLAWNGSSKNERLTNRIEGEYYVLLEQGHELEMLALKLPFTLQSAMTAGDVDMISVTAASQRDDFQDVIAEAKLVDSQRTADLDTLATLCLSYYEIASLTTTQMIDSGIDVDTAVFENVAIMHRRHDSLLEHVQDYYHDLKEEMRSQLSEASHRARVFRSVISWTIIFCLVGMIGLSALASWSIVRPVRRLREVAEDIAEGDMSTPLDYQADDDLGRLADAFRRMRTSLSEEFDRRTEAEQALRASEQRLALGFDAANDGLWDFDTRSGTFYFSPRYYDMLGYKPKNLSNTLDGIRSKIHPDDLALVDNSFQAHLEHGYAFDVEMRIKHGDGIWCWIQQRGKIVERDADGEPIRVVGTIVDICIRKEAEEQLLERTQELEKALDDLRGAQSQLIQSEKMASLGQFAAGLAHELNNPIGALQASTDIMARAQGRLDEVFEVAGTEVIDCSDPRLTRALKALGEGRHTANVAAARVSELVGALKSFTNLDQADLQKTDPVRGIESALTVLRAEIGDRIKVVRDYHDVPEITCYPADLNQMFLNLLSNAIEAIDGEGVVTLGASTIEDGVLLTVADTGRGISRKQLDQIFEVAFTSGERVKMGWGMTMIQQVVRKHNGSINIESDVGEGTVVSITLPLLLS
jgi:two-component system, NtrC family, sensor kinase